MATSTLADSVSHDNRDQPDQFDWIKFYSEFADKLLKYKTNRRPLITKCHEVHNELGFTSLKKDKLPDGKTGPLTDICPFTTLALFSRKIKDDKRKKIAGKLADFLKVKIPAPNSFEGMPIMNPQNTWFFPHANNRGAEHIDELWDVFASALKYADNDNGQTREEFAMLFNSAVKRPYVKTRLTIGLFWSRPQKFLSLDNVTTKYIEPHVQIPTQIESVEDPAKTYLDIINLIKSDTSFSSFPQLSLDAYKSSQMQRKEQNRQPRPKTVPTEGTEEVEEPTAKTEGRSWTLSDIKFLTKELLWEDPSYLKDIIRGLEDKKQIIFRGPPGTGKTFVAMRIAKMCKKRGGDFRIVQFHPSYSYEDFVEGYRPQIQKGVVGFSLVHGPLKDIADKARKNPNATFVIVIDEINRGNVTKVLGELYFLLEYRGESISLQYGGEFSMPENLWLIGTMNTADRSIALMDAALRRRFHFFDFFPDDPPIKGLLRRWLQEHSPQMLWVADMVDSANKKLDGKHARIGPSYFMQKGLSHEDGVRFIWDRSVIPYIEELFLDDDDVPKTFSYDRLREAQGNSAENPSGTRPEDVSSSGE